jgi:hypothetical protein
LLALRSQLLDHSMLVENDLKQFFAARGSATAEAKSSSRALARLFCYDMQQPDADL